MGIYAPKPLFSSNDKRLLTLMAGILLEYLEGDYESQNIPTNWIPISDAEAEELVRLLQRLLESRDFIQKTYFVEQMSDQTKLDDGSLREIFLSFRKKRGRTRVASSNTWLDFQYRLGLAKEAAAFLIYPPMDFDYFLNMERRLFKELGLHPKVAELLLSMVGGRRKYIEKVRDGKRPISKGEIGKSISSLIKSIQNDLNLSLGNKLLSPERLTATITILANLSVLFTTRDWSVAGTISAMAGAYANTGKGN